MTLIMNNIDASNIISLPLAFVRSGWVNLAGGLTDGVGRDGYRWSRTIVSDIHAYDLRIYPTYVLPSSYNGRRDAFSLRWLYGADGGK